MGRRQYETFEHALRIHTETFMYSTIGMKAILKDRRIVCVVPETDWYIAYLIYPNGKRLTFDRKMQSRDAKYVRIFVENNLLPPD